MTFLWVEHLEIGDFIHDVPGGVGRRPHDCYFKTSTSSPASTPGSRKEGHSPQSVSPMLGTRPVGEARERGGREVGYTGQRQRLLLTIN